MCLSCICLFVLHALTFVVYSSWCPGLAAASDCGIPCVFLLTFYIAHCNSTLRGTNNLRLC